VKKKHEETTKQAFLHRAKETRPGKQAVVCEFCGFARRERMEREIKKGNRFKQDKNTTVWASFSF
jgi:hypothetical protein